MWAQDALLANPEHRRLYSSSAYFKTAVDTVAQQLIPAMMTGFALQAEEADRRLAEAYEVMLRAPAWGPLLVTPWECCDDHPEPRTCLNLGDPESQWCAKCKARG